MCTRTKGVAIQSSAGSRRPTERSRSGGYARGARWARRRAGRSRRGHANVERPGSAKRIHPYQVSYPNGKACKRYGFCTTSKSSIRTGYVSAIACATAHIYHSIERAATAYNDIMRRRSGSKLIPYIQRRRGCKSVTSNSRYGLRSPYRSPCCSRATYTRRKGHCSGTVVVRRGRRCHAQAKREGGAYARAPRVNP